jgi:hypothetical protein
LRGTGAVDQFARAVPANPQFERERIIVQASFGERCNRTG